MAEDILGIHSLGGLTRLDSVFEIFETEMLEASSSCGGFIKGIPTGFPSLDTAINGWKKGCVSILAGYAGVGKTTLALNFVHNVIFNEEHPIPTLYISLGSTEVQIIKRLFSIHLSKDHLLTSIDKEDKDARSKTFEQSREDFLSAPFYIDANPRLEYDKVRKTISEIMVDHPIGLVVIDYINIMQPPAVYQGMREQEISAISRELKHVARELEVPILAIATLKRPHKDTHSRPKLSDLKESNALEYDADEIMFLSENTYYGLSEDPDDCNKARLVLEKNRHGYTTDIDLQYDRINGLIREREIIEAFSEMNDDSSDNDEFM